MYRLQVKTAVVIVLMLVLTPTVWGVTDGPTIKGEKLSDNYVLTIQNPDQLSINTTFYNHNTREINESYVSNDKLLTYIFSNDGSWYVSVKVDGEEAFSDYFGLGSIFDSGFKATMGWAFDGNLYLIGVTILLGVSIFAVSIGRYAGLPLVVVTIGILSMENYMSTWINYIILLVAAFAFATGIYIAIGGRTG